MVGPEGATGRYAPWVRGGASGSQDHGRVCSLSVAPVKGTALCARDAVRLTRHGVPEDRRFHIVDELGRLCNQKQCPALGAIRSAYDPEAGRLRLELADGTVVEAPVALGAPCTTDFYGRPVTGRVVTGPFAEAVSAGARRALRVVMADEAGAALDRGVRAAVSLLSIASLPLLAAAAQVRSVDARRFRMLVGIEETAAHAEDAWIGRTVRLGSATVRPLGQVGRCVVTTLDPDSGRSDLDTLRALRSYRARGDERLPFGVYAEVLDEGTVRVGDPVVALARSG